jgi:hypothetical protein
LHLTRSQRIGVGISITLILLLIAILGFAKVSTQRRINDLQRQVAELTLKVQAQDRIPSIEEQATCAKQAELFFKDSGYSNQADYASHFNPKLNKCFIVIRDRKYKKTGMTFSKQVFDAYEQKNYGNYLWIQQYKNGKKYWEVPPVECEVVKSDGTPPYCHSEDEFDEMMAQYYMDVKN